MQQETGGTERLRKYHLPLPRFHPPNTQNLNESNISEQLLSMCEKIQPLNGQKSANTATAQAGAHTCAGREGADGCGAHRVHREMSQPSTDAPPFRNEPGIPPERKGNKKARNTGSAPNARSAGRSCGIPKRRPGMGPT
ncbi:hypothetical protein SAV14893_021520 [Streptomyces avermitilis]|uniref:Uncharacterized protein n=1 Tax=Streptomyces avermitilis TaxID=33903 RepID=A0A4D4LXV5_STRAX|nr:hypothetical protein SAVMC3_33660 [Streptomyces avermitilis]GDY62759.1 hypothetical protein SAV14893_021520 [Streptomyces avermitilis]GDY77116.1 hypothetical protein SAV31267_066010 [Streptomyces avermitilis]GDY86028.1 hypothetical protein SAVCW2_52270 [Streptomyces avermitilis]